MSWDVETLNIGLEDQSPIFFILTNTRALDPEAASKVVKEVCHNLKLALGDRKDVLIVSRSDSTLRGHYPLETDIMAEELGGFDAHFLLPAFFEGGRITKDSVHYLLVEGVPTPVAETEFAKDSVFHYAHSYLPDYVEEKTKGVIPAEAVVRITTSEIRQGTFSRLMQLSNNTCVVVDGETQRDYDLFAEDLLQSVQAGKRFLLRSAASILTSLAKLGPQKVPATQMNEYKRTNKPGVILVGSHVAKTTQQLKKLLQEPAISPLEIDVNLLRDQSYSRKDLLQDILQKVYSHYAQGLTPIIYTSRAELTFSDVQSRLAFGSDVSNFLMDIVKGLPREISFLISKGGITSNDVLSNGLNVQTVRLLGQILPGCSLVKTEADHQLFPDLPVVLFPGNVGDEDALVTVFRRLK